MPFLFSSYSFPALSCEFASVDVTDVLGTVNTSLLKRLSCDSLREYLKILNLKCFLCDISLQHRFNITKTVRKFPIDPNLNQVGPQFHSGPLSKAVTHEDENHEPLNELDEGAAVLTAENFDRISSEYETSITHSCCMPFYRFLLDVVLSM